MNKVFVNVGLSLDGYMAPEGMTMENPGYKNWGTKWAALMAWLLDQQYMRANLKLGPGGEAGPVNDLVRSTTERIGANIMGKRMFDQGERAWPDEAPFHTPVYVLTNQKREPWVRPGGTTFHFINDGPLRALELARESAGGRDIRIAGGADVIQQYLNLRAVDELEIALAPVFFGGGRRLFENLSEPAPLFLVSTEFSRVRQQHTCATSVSEAEGRKEVVPCGLPSREARRVDRTSRRSSGCCLRRWPRRELPWTEVVARSPRPVLPTRGPGQAELPPAVDA